MTTYKIIATHLSLPTYIYPGVKYMKLVSTCKHASMKLRSLPII